MTTPGMTRRHFLRISLLAGGALLIESCARQAGVTTTTTLPPGTTTAPTTTSTSTTTTTTLPPIEGEFEASLWVHIDGSGEITITGHRTEMGQGVLTAMAMIVAEEMDADWSTVTVRQADADTAYGEQVTGGSTSIVQNYDRLRRVGAEARAILVAAAAAMWGVEAGECTTADGTVRHEASGRSEAYGRLVLEAADVDVASLPEPVLKDRGDFRIIGTSHPVAHSEAVLGGEPLYTSDLVIDGMRYAAVAYPPTFDGAVGSFDPAPALAVAGVEDVVEIPTGVAVIAADTWSAIRGRDALQVDWDLGREASDSAARIATLREEAGDGVVYDHPFYAHAPMETMGCVVDLGSGSCEVWAPVQRPQEAREAVAEIVGLDPAAVTLHVVMAGGRFGRGLRVDFVEDAAQIAVAAGLPVKMVWTREDDLRRDMLHPFAVIEASSGDADPLGTISLDMTRANIKDARWGAWRSVRHFPEAFAHESYVDEVAAGLGLDPVAARLQTLSGRAAEVVRVAGRESGWGTPLPTGWGRGIAYHSTWGATHVAEVAEVSVEHGEIRVHRVVCVVDCGLAVNPDGVRAQMEGGIVWGLTAVLKNGVEVQGSRVMPANFDGFPILRFDEMPLIEVHLVDSGASPSGTGEMSVPPLAPAVANAVFDATGQRLRSLPLRLEG